MGTSWHNRKKNAFSLPRNTSIALKNIFIRQLFFFFFSFLVVWLNHSTSLCEQWEVSVVHVQECHCFRQKYILHETFSLDSCLRVPTFAAQRQTHANDPHRTEVLERHYIQPALSFWLLLLKCQQHHSDWFIATVQCACSFLSYIEGYIIMQLSRALVNTV